MPHVPTGVAGCRYPPVVTMASTPSVFSDWLVGVSSLWLVALVAPAAAVGTRDLCNLFLVWLVVRVFFFFMYV